MKRRVVALAAALPVLLTLFVIAPYASASASFESLVEVTGYSVSRADMSARGSIAEFTITVSFPQLSVDNNANGFYDDGSLTIGQLQELVVSMGPNSDFGFANGAQSATPFAGRDLTAYPGDPSAVTATFNISLIYNGGQGILEIVLSHPTKADAQGTIADAISAKPVYINETSSGNSSGSPDLPGVPDIPSIPDTPSYPNPDATPYLTITGNLPRLEAGKAGRIRFSLVNNSRHTAYRVSVTISGGNEEILRPTSITIDTISVGTIYNSSANTKNVEIPVEVFDDVKEGYYTITLLLTMENGAGVPITQNSNIQVFVRNPKSGESFGIPSINVTSATIDNNVPPVDGAITLTLDIANIGDGTASNARISLTGFMSSEITLNESLVTKSLGDIASGENSSVTYSLKVASGLEAGSYPLVVEVRYKLPDGTDGTMSDTAYINIMRPSDTNSNIQLVGISQDLSNPGSANIIRVTFTLQNKGDTIADDVSLGLGGLSSSAFTLSGDFGDRKIGSIDPDGTAETTIALYVSESLPNGNYPLSVLLRYSDSGAVGSQMGETETEVYIFVNRPEKIEPDDNPDTSVPRVIISRHSISVDTVVAGEPFELSVTLFNTSMNKNIKNLKVTVTDKDGIFIPVEGVNSFYIPEIPIDQTTDIAIILAAKQDAETKSYPISISLDYEDEKNTPYSVTESLSIPVYLPQRLEISNVNFYDEGTGMAYLSFQFINKGKAPLYNMNIRVEGPMNAMEGDYYIGTFGPGQADYFEDSIILQMYGDVSGDIVLEFEDSSGAQQEHRYQISAYIGEPYMQDPGFPGGDMMWPMDPNFPFEDGFSEEGGGFKSWMIWTIIGGVVIIGGVLTIVIIKKKKHKRDELADDE